MSGPSLRRADSHSSIHEAALNEARDLTDLLAQLLRKKMHAEALKTALILLEHWETRTLAHAQAEEEGLYPELLAENENMKDKLTVLARDHDLMRKLAQAVKKDLQQEKLGQQTVQQFYALICIDEIHNHEEESVLPHH
ncbi:hemerythrin domain-containing protein [Heyndrickxia faecalis]|uniref:hemerythrin domain-containing protein n=1 Tax=Heyndrickxia faecalis TaxID=2824910 RepID=UPI003D1A419F